MKYINNFEKTCISIFGLSKTRQKISNSKNYFITRKERIINRFLTIFAIVAHFGILLGLIVAVIITRGIFNIPVLIFGVTFSIIINLFYKEFKRINLKTKEFETLNIQEKKEIEFMFLNEHYKDKSWN